MWISRAIFCPKLLIILTFCLIVNAEGEENGAEGQTSKQSTQKVVVVRKVKNKRSKDMYNGRLNLPQHQQHNPTNPLFDQIAQETDFLEALGQVGTDDGGGSSVSGSGTSGPGYLNYGMRVNQNPSTSIKLMQTKARNPRADPSYLRNYHYGYPRDGPPPGNYGGVDRGGSSGGDGRLLSSFGIHNLQSSASSPSDYVFGDGGGVDDNTVAAGHQQGWGWGHGGGHSSGGHGHGKDCNSALGLLGVLGLASYLQNVLRQMSTAAPAPAPAPGRKRRETQDEKNSSPPKPQNDLVTQLLPLMVSMSHARNGIVPIKCIFRPFCIANSIVSRRLGEVGRPVCQQLGSIMKSSLENNANLRPKWRLVNAIRDLRIAGKTGEKGKNCYKYYPHCPILETLSQNSTTGFLNGGISFMGTPILF